MCLGTTVGGISLLSIPGKVYASMILLHRITSQVEGKLSEAQCGFCSNRGTKTVDAIFVLRSLGAACGEFNMCLAKAYIDLTKAYDSINRWALAVEGVAAVQCLCQASCLAGGSAYWHHCCCSAGWELGACL